MSDARAQTFNKTLELESFDYGVEILPDTLERLTSYYLLLEKWNERLHLVAPCPPAEFARRHVLESLMLLPYLPNAARVADIGSGAGLPMIPCLIARSDLRATLIESSKRKAVFLREALNLTAKAESATVIADRFEQISAPDAQIVTCRALERFVEMLPLLIDWAPPSAALLLFGGIELRKALQSTELSLTEIEIPNSERRFLFVCNSGSSSQ